MALPEGVPERLAVTCNGRSAAFLVRQQRMLFQNMEMAPSRYEQMSGKGDAKKWKCSVFTENMDGQQVGTDHTAAHSHYLSQLL